MNESELTLIADIRSFNRFYTRILGLLNRHLLDSPFSLTEARVLYEIGTMEACTAHKLIAELGLNRGYISRILKNFEKIGLIQREISSSDRRSAYLTLSPKGEQALSSLEASSNRQIQALIKPMGTNEREQLRKAMQTIKTAMSAGLHKAVIREFRTDDLAYIIESHKRLYKAEYDFDETFTEHVATGINKMLRTRDESAETIWVAELNGVTVGSIAVVKAGEGVAQLRWFLLEPGARGLGLGKRLMDTALAFCHERGYRHAFLWTVSLLAAARHLYERFGFSITETKDHDLWGRHLVEERWDLSFDQN
jgi:DNA-binding MarR family transcriptional regulator/GNAT superfamily N-acetyltransferase